MKVSLIGFGNVSRQVIDALEGGRTEREKIEIVAIGRRDAGKGGRGGSYRGIPFVDHGAAISLADTVVETAVPDVVPALLETVIPAGKTLIVISAGGLVDVHDLSRYEARHVGRLIVANGMIPGLDILRAARESGLDEVRLDSQIKPQSFVGEDYIIRHGITLPDPGEDAVRVFSGSAREAAREFPRHFNVAIALSLAGIGLDKTQITVFADPDVRGARHRVRASSAAVDLDLVSYGYPSVDNPKTSRLVAPSIVSTLLDLQRVVRVGS